MSADESGESTIVDSGINYGERFDSLERLEAWEAGYRVHLGRANTNKAMARRMLYRVHKTRGFVLAGYETWPEYVEGRMNLQRAYAFRLVAATRVEIRIASEFVDTLELNESQLNTMASSVMEGHEARVLIALMEKDIKITGPSIEAMAHELGVHIGVVKKGPSEDDIALVAVIEKFVKACGGRRQAVADLEAHLLRRVKR